jgi:ABC-type uncharacterized transport system substrate-binding protein
MASCFLYRRRDFAAGLLLAAIARSVPAQQPGKQYRIALVHPTIPANQLTEKGGTFYQLFFVELHRSGYTEGGNLIVERYSAEGHPDRFADLAREIVIGNDFATVFNAATRTIPILAIMIDPIRTGTVASLAHPGGNITGISLDAGFEIYGKRLQILKELIPAASRVGFLAVRDEWDSPGGLALRDTARSLDISLIDISLLDVDPSAIRRAFAEMPQQRLDAVLVGQIPLLQCCNARLRLRISRREPAQHCNPPHSVRQLGYRTVRRKQPSSHTANKRDELAPPHSRTSLARATNTSDKETPSDAAVFRLTAM